VDKSLIRQCAENMNPKPQVDPGRLPHVIALTHDSKFVLEGRANTSNMSSFLDRVIDSTRTNGRVFSPEKSTPFRRTTSAESGNKGAMPPSANDLQRTTWSYASLPKDSFRSLLDMAAAEEEEARVGKGGSILSDKSGGTDGMVGSVEGTSPAVSDNDYEKHREDDEVTDLRASGISFIPKVAGVKSPGIMPAGLGSPGMRPKLRAPPKWQTDFGTDITPSFPDHDEPPGVPTIIKGNLDLFEQHTGDVRVVLFTAMETVPVLWDRLAELHGGGASDHGGARCSFWVVKAEDEAIMSQFKVTRAMLPRIVAIKPSGEEVTFHGGVSQRSLSIFVLQASSSSNPALERAKVMSNGSSRFGL